MSNWKRYLTAIGINLFVGLLFALGCEGEGCMIILIMAMYISATVISYLPYLFLGRYKSLDKIKAYPFLLPSILMFSVILIYTKLGSNIPLNSHNLLSIVGSIIPNTILQIILFLIEKKSLKDLIKQRDLEERIK